MDHPLEVPLPVDHPLEAPLPKAHPLEVPLLKAHPPEVPLQKAHQVPRLPVKLPPHLTLLQGVMLLRRLEQLGLQAMVTAVHLSHPSLVAHRVCLFA